MDILACNLQITPLMRPSSCSVRDRPSKTKDLITIFGIVINLRRVRSPYLPNLGFPVENKDFASWAEFAGGIDQTFK